MMNKFCILCWSAFSLMLAALGALEPMVEGNYASPFTYRLQLGERLHWCQRGLLHSSLPWPKSAEADAILLKEPTWPVTAIDNQSTAAIEIMHTGELLSPDQVCHFTPPFSELLSFKRLPLGSREKAQPTLSFTYHAPQGAEATLWPPQQLALLLPDEQQKLMFLAATVCIDREKGTVNLAHLACQSSLEPLGEDARRELGAQRRAIFQPQVITEGNLATIAWPQDQLPQAAALQIHCLNKLFTALPLELWQNSQEITFCWPLGPLIPQQGDIAIPIKPKMGKIKRKEGNKPKKYLYNLITRVSTPTKVEKLSEQVEEWARDTQRLFGPRLLGDSANLKVPAVAAGGALPPKGYVRPPSVSREAWERMRPYFLPENHPVRHKLDRLFRKRILLNESTVAKAGFLTPQPRSFSHCIVSKHSRIKGFVFKFYTDQQSNDEVRALKKRINGAREIRRSIQKLGWGDIFLVPKKFIYPLPPQPAPPSHLHRKHFILLAEEMDIFSGVANRNKWGQKITPLLLQGVYSIVTDAGLCDSLIPSNIPFMRNKEDKVLVFIDTEHFHEWSIPYDRISPYLSPKMQRAWHKLVNRGQVITHQRTGHGAGRG